MRGSSLKLVETVADLRSRRHQAKCRARQIADRPAVHGSNSTRTIRAIAVSFS
jgi:hypothetical protein